MIFDAHLDLAMNATLGRDITRPAAEQPARPNEVATVGLPDLRAGGVTEVCATIFCCPDVEGHPGYKDAQGAYDQAIEQLAVYHRLHTDGELHFPALPGGKPAEIRAAILLEGADAIRTPDDLEQFHKAGVRLVGLAWRRTRYAGGTGEPGPLTDLGRAIVPQLDRLNIIHDASHLAEEAFWELSRRTDRMIIASHSNCRTIVGDDPNGRHLTDDMIREIVRRDGVIGINFFDKFLLPAAEFGQRRATLDDVLKHILHICDLAGDTTHVGIGTDMDGGLGRDQIPQEIQTSADMPRIAPILESAGFDAIDITRIMRDNWMRVLSPCFASA